ncbi:hypothetical protein PIB30_049218 [Stylosanthes scabra]|uniref:Uncharacterized protein n=1 Tax=Stylosanthes scabra TaxID=79078 RepID=A0ABU6ZG30_9FABA|nr:hypothetical protein [Stylosanthes scabra]
MGVVPSHKYPPLFSDPDDDDTASGPPDLREQVTLLNREISQQAEAHAQSLAAVEAACAEKVRTLESTVQTQSQEVSDLRRAYSDMYSFLTQMRSGASGSVLKNFKGLRFIMKQIQASILTIGINKGNINMQQRQQHPPKIAWEELQWQVMIMQFLSDFYVVSQQCPIVDVYEDKIVYALCHVYVKR